MVGMVVNRVIMVVETFLQTFQVMGSTFEMIKGLVRAWESLK